MRYADRTPCLVGTRPRLRARLCRPLDATVTHWLLYSNWPVAIVNSVPVPHSVKAPLERRVWYAYPGQPAATEIGTMTHPSGNDGCVVTEDCRTEDCRLRTVD